MCDKRGVTVSLRERKWSFVVLVLGPAVVWPGVSLLGMTIPWTRELGLALFLAYELPPLLMAFFLGLVNEGGPNVLFGGVSIPVPTFPLGWVFCSFFWFLLGGALWLAFHGIRLMIGKGRNGVVEFDRP